VFQPDIILCSTFIVTAL